MPTLEFEGKAFVYSHHLSVPYRELIPVAAKGVGAPDLDGNLIIHGDNLEALKALRGQGGRHLHRPPAFHAIGGQQRRASWSALPPS